MSLLDSVRHFFHLDIPAKVEGDKIIVPSFEIPLGDELLLEPIVGAIEVEPEADNLATVKVALKKKPAPKKKSIEKSTKKPAAAKPAKKKVAPKK